MPSEVSCCAQARLRAPVGDVWSRGLHSALCTVYVQSILHAPDRYVVPAGGLETIQRFVRILSVRDESTGGGNCIARESENIQD